MYHLYIANWVIICYLAPTVLREPGNSIDPNMKCIANPDPVWYGCATELTKIAMTCPDMRLITSTLQKKRHPQVSWGMCDGTLFALRTKRCFVVSKKTNSAGDLFGMVSSRDPFKGSKRSGIKFGHSESLWFFLWKQAAWMQNHTRFTLPETNSSLHHRPKYQRPLKSFEKNQQMDIVH